MANISKESKEVQEVPVERQVELIERGTAFIKLLRPATIGGGIFQFDKQRQKSLIERFDKESENVARVKFVPASGAATRMFKEVYAFIEAPEKHEKEINAFFKQVERLAFFDDWMAAADKHDLETFEAGLKSKVAWLKLLVESNGMGLAQQPKGLIPFHAYDGGAQCPVVEHLKEGMAYAMQNGKVRIDFTVSPDHEEDFRKEAELWCDKEPFDQVEWDITYSHQVPSTDTIAIDEKAALIQGSNGKSIRRPGGHGALIHNLNALDADVVFIKNIDNVTHDRLLDVTVRSKKMLAGLLLEFRADLKGLKLDLNKGLVDEQFINDLREKWGMRIPRDYKKLKKYINRPIRVCGMVKNQGEPGGGPFWTIDSNTGESLQIIEKTQVDPNDSRQQRIAEGSTHFNPVDLVCYMKDMEDQPIDLTEFVNEDQHFVVEKFLGGKPIKGLEWPGLWNGGMADWITLFVEVPEETFNPVKELKDLYRKNHHPEGK